jgi:hypothetical protein
MARPASLDEDRMQRAWLQTPPERMGVRYVHFHSSRVGPSSAADRDAALNVSVKLSRPGAQTPRRSVPTPRRSQVFDVSNRDKTRPRHL